MCSSAVSRVSTVASRDKQAQMTAFPANVDRVKGTE